MKIKDILMDASLLLGLNDEYEILKDVNEESEMLILQENKKIASLFDLVKYSVRELCSNYIPVINKNVINVQDKKYPINEIPNFIRINSILKNGQKIQYKIINRNIIFEEDGEYVIEYFTYPQINSLFDEIDYLLELIPDAMVMGLCAYFSLAHGMFNEFDEFHEKYITKAESFKVLKSFKLPSRRWE